MPRKPFSAAGPRPVCARSHGRRSYRCGGRLPERQVSRCVGRGLGVRVYDFGADLELPADLESRSYRFALYLTMKSLPREPG